MPRERSHFQFKRFNVYHDRSTMKVGTDAVLLGTWATVNDAVNVLDIGAGSGVIALMLAQRSNNETKIDAVELEPDDAQQARENIALSPWPHKVKVHECAIQNYMTELKYDLIISNPPYFQNSFKPPDERRIQTRHTVTLSFSDLAINVKRLLADDGKFNVILPFTEGLEFIDLAKKNKLHCTRQCSFRSRRDKSIERWLLEFSFINHPIEQSEIILYEYEEEWSSAYKLLTKEFYLKL